MNGLIKRTVAGVCLAAGLTASTGCYGYRQLVDTCYPERYNYAARKAVCSALCPQLQNARILDETVWNWHFVEGSDKLNNAGMEHLTYLVRRRPGGPDTRTVFLATASDVKFVAGGVDKYVKDRTDLNTKRMKAVQEYLDGAVAGTGRSFQVSADALDAPEPGIIGEGVRRAHGNFLTHFTGTIGTVSGLVSTSSAPTTPGGAPQ